MYAVAQNRVVQISDPIVWTHINSYRPTHQVRPAYYYLMTVQDADYYSVQWSKIRSLLHNRNTEEHSTVVQ